MNWSKIEHIRYLSFLALCVGFCCCKEAKTYTDKPCDNIIPKGIYIGMTQKEYQEQAPDSVTISDYKFEMRPQFDADTLSGLFYYHEYEGTDTIYKRETREINCRDMLLDSVIQTSLTCRYGNPEQLRNQLLWKSGSTTIRMGYDDEDDFMVSKHSGYDVYTTNELMIISIKNKD